MDFEVDNKSFVKSEKTFCDTCLSADKTLTTFPQETEVYRIIFQGLTVKMLSYSSLKLCWECTAIIRKFIRFKKQALLVLQNPSLLTSISKLAISPKINQENIYPDEDDIKLKDLKLLTNSKSDDALAGKDCLRRSGRKRKGLSNSVKDNKKSKKDNKLKQISPFITVTVEPNDIDDVADALNDNNDAKIETDDAKLEELDVNVEEADAKVESDDANFEVDFDANDCDSSGDENLVVREKVKRRKRISSATENKGKKPDSEKRYLTYIMTESEMQAARNRERNRPPYLSYLYKSESCIMSFSTEKNHKIHLKTHHVKKAGNTKCSICGHYVREESLLKHKEEHLNLYVCRYCTQKCYPNHDHSKKYYGECPAAFVNKMWIYKHCVNHNFHRKKKKLQRATSNTSDIDSSSDFKRKTDQYKVYQMNEYEMILARERERQRAPFLKFPFQCEPCALSYPTQSALDTHMVQHSPKKKSFKCDVCTRYIKASLYVPHREEHFKLYICNVCSEECCSKHDHKQFNKECSASFVNHTWICKHCYNEHREESWTCHICGKVSKKKIQHQVHVGRHTSHECPVCHKMIKGHHYLDRHIKSCHQQWSWEETYCAECDKQFKNLYSYRAHLKTNKRHLTEHDKKHLCPHCPKKYAQGFDLRDHINREHLKIPLYGCDRCEQKFVAKKQLERHIKKIHLNWRPPRNKICNVCQKGFTATPTLRKHMYTHTGERPYKCQLCPATFTQNSTLSTHHKLVHLKLRKVTKSSKPRWEPKHPVYESLTLINEPNTSTYQHILPRNVNDLPRNVNDLPLTVNDLPGNVNDLSRGVVELSQQHTLNVRPYD